MGGDGVQHLSHAGLLAALLVGPGACSGTSGTCTAGDGVGTGLTPSPLATPAVPYTLQALAADTAAVDSLVRTVGNTYDAEGNLVASATLSVPSSDAMLSAAFEYDAAGRLRYRSHGAGPRILVYDPAGNVVKAWTGSGDSTIMAYDALNRLTRRVSAPDTIQQTGCGTLPTGPISGAACQMVFPYYTTANAGSALVIPGDSAVFAYDTTGNLRQADNRYARIRRSYYPNGLLHHDTLGLGSYSAPHLNRGSRLQVHGYDLAGRPTSMAWFQGTTHYAYHDYGALRSITDPSGTRYEWHHTPLGLPMQLLVTPAGGTPGYTRDWRYDAAGRLVALESESAILGGLRSDSLAYDARDKIRRVWSSSRALGTEETTSAYDGLGAVMAFERVRDGAGAHDIEEYRNDALGNVLYSRRRASAGGTTLPFVSMYQVNGALQSRQAVLPASPALGDVHDELWQEFTAGGDLRIQSQLQRTHDHVWLLQVAARHYYDGEGRLAAVQRYNWRGTASDGTWEEYRYDALGRRVLTRVRRDAADRPSQSVQLCSGSPECRSYYQWTWWDGDRILMEEREPDGTSNSYTSGTVSYIAGLTIDQPVAVLRAGVTRVINYDWRGLGESSVLPTGAAGDCALAPGSCALVRWPSRTGVYYTPHLEQSGSSATPTWLGTLAENGGGSAGLL